MKITHLVGGSCSGESANGVDRSLVHFARRQAKLGHEVKLMGVTRKSPYPIEGVESVTAPPGVSLFYPSRETRDEILRGGPDVLHLHGAYVPIYPGIAHFARKMGLPYVLTPHGNYSQLLLKRQPVVKSLYRRFMELPMAQRALFIHAIDDQEEIRKYGVVAPIVSAINGMDLPDPEESLDQQDILVRFGVPPGGTLFLFLGRLDIPQKGLDLLVRGFARLVQVVDPSSDAHLVLAGPSRDGSKGKLESLAADLGIRDQMTMPGGVFGDEKKALIRQCDFFVHPSRWEAGVPFSVLEALAYGKQCLVSSAVDRQKVLQQSGVGELCELTVEGMAMGLSVLSQQAPEERARKALKAQELILRDFSWETSAQKLVDGYRKFLSGGLR